MSDLIYGKNKTEGIVSIEVEDDKAFLFIEENGELKEEVVPNRFWILSEEKLKKEAVRLEGNLTYKYGLQYKERSEYTKMRNIFKNKEVYSIYNAQEALMVKDGYTYFKGFKDHKSISTLSFDIETTGLTMDKNSTVILIANTYRKGDVLIRKMFCYDEYESQKEMIDTWCNWVREINPSFMVGHNILIYDIPYLMHCAKMSGTYLKLGRNDSAPFVSPVTSKFRKDGSQTLDYNKIRIYGREIIDTMFLSIKYDIARKFPSYRLKEIIQFLDLEVEGRVFYDASTIRDNYKDPIEFEKIKKYAEHDGDDSLSLFDKMIPAQFFWTQSVPKTFQEVNESATGSQLNSILVRSYLQEKHSIPKADEVQNFEGGISMGVPGIYKNAFKVDIQGAYPSSIIIANLYDEKKDPKAHFLNMVKILMQERVKDKKMFKQTNDPYYEGLQSAKKIAVNSAYGLCGAPGLNFNSPKIAAKITEMTRGFLDRAIIATTGKDHTYWNPNLQDEENEE